MMENYAKHSNQASEKGQNIEDLPPISRRHRSVSNSRQEDVLSVSSWSDFDKLDLSDSSIRDHDLDPESEPLPVHRAHVPPRQVQQQNVNKDLTGFMPIPTQDEPIHPVPNTTQHSKLRSAGSASSQPRRSRSSSNVERGSYRRSCGAQYVETIPNLDRSSYDITSQHDFCYNPFQDFSFLGYPAVDSPRTCVTAEQRKNTSSFKNSPKLYPVLDNLEYMSNGTNSFASHSGAGHRYLGEFHSDGPASMPVISDSSDCESSSPFTSLPVSVTISDHLHSKENEIPFSEDSKRSRHSKDSQQKGQWSFWKLTQSQPSLSKVPVLKRQPKSSSDLEALRESFEHRLEHDNVKTKVMSAWNNFKYGWMFNTKSTIKYDSPLFMLGKCYHMRRSDNDNEPANEFQKDFTSRIWMTYRSNFYPIPGTKLNTDCGWGCMLRSAQMLISQCLVTHYLGRDWRLHNPQTETQYAYYREIIRWFSDPVDAPSDKMPFSLHHLVSFGRHYNKEPGEWFGPSSAAYIFRDAFARASQSLPILSQLCIYVAQDCTVYIDDVMKLCTARDKSESLSNSSDAENFFHQEKSHDNTWLRSLILLIPMRLGGEVMNEIYVPCVKNLLAQENCMGIIGGKPKHSLYFIGWQENKLIHLDPHYCREAVDTTDKNFKIETYHCMTPKKLTVTRMDPSCTVGFYIRNVTEFKKFVEEVREFVFPERQRGAYPLFIFTEGSHNDSSQHDVHTGQDRGRVKVTHYQIDKNGQKQRTYSRDSEDFIIL